MKDSIDARGVLDAAPFSYRASKDGTVFIAYHGRPVTVLKGREAERFLARIQGATEKQQQLAMAKCTGNFKHGNERAAKRR